MNTRLKTAVAVAGLFMAAQATAQVTFYERENFRGREFTAVGTVDNFSGTGFNDRASSVVVERGRWEACEDANFEGRCIVLRPGRYDSLADMGMANRISSVRPLEREARYLNEVPPPVAMYDSRPALSYDSRPAPGYDSRPAPSYDSRPAPSYDSRPVPSYAYDYQPRPDERLYQANVTSVHAVLGPPEQRCWVDRQQVVEDRNIPGAIAGAVIGGILGHQIGGGRGRDIATAGGAVAGGAIGLNAGGGGYYTQDVQRCASAPSGRPEFWDVTYDFRGQEHRVQMSAPPGSTITVNGDGEPRG